MAHYSLGHFLLYPALMVMRTNILILCHSDTDATVPKTKGDSGERRSTQEMALGHGHAPPTRRVAVSRDELSPRDHSPYTQTGVLTKMNKP